MGTSKPSVVETNVSQSDGSKASLALVGRIAVEGQPWVPVGSTLGPRFFSGIRVSPQKIRLR